MWGCRFQLELGENEVTHSEEMGNKDLFFFKGTKKKIFKESLIIMVRLLRVAKPILLTLVMLCSFKLAESLTGDVERPCALCQGIKTTCSQSRMAGERSSSYCIT